MKPRALVAPPACTRVQTVGDGREVGNQWVLEYRVFTVHLTEETYIVSERNLLMLNEVEAVTVSTREFLLSSH